MKYKKDWFVYPQHANRFHLGDTAPSGTCRVIADFTPRPCVTGCGDETPTEAEALENVVLASQAPALLTALRRLLEAPALNMDDLEPGDIEAIDAATRACELADLSPAPQVRTPLQALRLLVNRHDGPGQISEDDWKIAREVIVKTDPEENPNEDTL